MLARHLEGMRSAAERPALDDDSGAWTYGQLLEASAKVADALLGGRSDLEGARVGLMTAPSRAWVAGLLGIWRAGGFAVPLALGHPERELAYALDDAEVRQTLCSADFEPRLAAAAPDVRRLDLESILAGDEVSTELPEVVGADPALLIYTSGTTGKPKGVVLSHGNLEAQTDSLHQAWGWSSEDRILEVLPLHHVHGIVNVVLCSLFAGASCRLMPRFDAEAVWQSLAEEGMTLFMAVPTIYVRLIAAWDEANAARREAWSEASRRLRLMVSGSAALPVPVLERWRQLTGHTLLERYGMSEIGMALSNPLHGDRIAGAVGSPLPGVELRLVDASQRPVPEGEAGEVEVRGPAVFDRYWRRPEATEESFRDGWFQTGDVATCVSGVYRLLGRSSVDILKTGGEKVSALEIEAVLREHPSILDCAVVGLADPEWGQRVAAALETSHELTLEELRTWARERLAVYKLPTRLLCVASLPRNALGKVQKPRVASLFDV